MTELFLLILGLAVVGVVYGFYDVARPWLKIKAKNIIPKLKRLVPKIPKRKTKPKPQFKDLVSPQHIAPEVHSKLTSRPWGSISPSDRLQYNRSQSAQAARLQQALLAAENDLFWRQIAKECQRVTGSTDFKSYDPDLGVKKKEK